MKILDLTAGNRAIWYNKKHPLATYLDKRPEVNPDIVCDTNIEIPGDGYDLIVWDPPHMNCGPNSNMSKNYGYHKTHEILETIHKTAINIYNKSPAGALLAFKWNNHDIKLKRVFDLMPQWEPLFGHLVKRGGTKHVSETYWVMFKKNPAPQKGEKE